MGDHAYRIYSMAVDMSGVDVIESYGVGGARVHVTHDGRYLVSEPAVPPGIDELYDAILKKIDLSVGLGSEDDPDVMADRLEKEFWDTARRLGRHAEAAERFANVSYYMRRDLVGFGILDVMMRDHDIEDILCSAHSRTIRVIHRRYSGMFHTLDTNVSFADSREMERFIQRIYGRTGTEPTESRPISVTYMQDGSRISCTFGSQVSKPGPVIAVRKFSARPLTITDMMNNGTITAQAAAYVWTLLDAKAVGLIIGVTGSGKTTLLSSLVTMMNPRWRILTIEDTPELQIPHHDWVRYNTRRSYGMLSDKYDVSIRDLIDSSLTQRPDFEVIGEIRLADMDALFQSVGTGHGGLTSFHASTPLGAITRMRGNGISDGEIALTWFVMHSALVGIDGMNARRVSDISEVVADENTGKISIRPVYRYDMVNDTLDVVQELGSHRRYMEALAICGVRDAKHDMGRRTALLERCVRCGATDPADVFDILGEYYSKTDES